MKKRAAKKSSSNPQSQRREPGAGDAVEHGKDFPSELSAGASSDRSTGLNAILELLARRKHAELELQNLNASLEEQVAKRVAALAVLQDITIAANEARNLRDAANVALKRICEYNDWAVGHAWCVSEENNDRLVSLRAWFISEGPRRNANAPIEEFQRISEETTIPIFGHFVGHVTRSSEPKWLEDVNQFSGWIRGNPVQFGFTAAIAFPVVVDGRAVAVLEFFSYDPIQREERFMEIMTSVGIQLGHVFRRQRLERAIDTAATEYQRFIAQELHDGVAQELTGTTMLAEILQKSIADGKPDMELAQKLRQHLREAGEQVRQLSHGLMPVVVDAEGLMYALGNLAQQASEMYSLPCRFVCKSLVTLENAGVATHLYRIAQEALQNAAKHSQAKQVDLILRREGEDVLLIIHDNGTGIADAKDTTGQGWQIMQHRANLIGGELKIRSADNQGVTITCRVRQPDRSHLDSDR